MDKKICAAASMLGILMSAGASLQLFVDGVNGSNDEHLTGHGEFKEIADFFEEAAGHADIVMNRLNKKLGFMEE